MTFTARIINTNARLSSADTGTSHAWPKRRAKYADRLINMEPDVLAFQELRSKVNSDDTMSQVAYMQSRLPGWQTFVMPESNVVTMVRGDWPAEVRSIVLPRQPNAAGDYLLVVRVQLVSGAYFRVSNHHVSTDDPTMYRQESALAYHLDRIPWLVSCGDWNVADSPDTLWSGHEFGTYDEHPGYLNCHHWGAQEKGTPDTDRILVRPAEAQLDVVKQKFTDADDESDHNIIFSEVVFDFVNQWTGS